MNKPYLTSLARSTGFPFSVPNLDKMCRLAGPLTINPWAFTFVDSL